VPKIQPQYDPSRSEPAQEIVQSDDGPALRIRHEGGGNALEVVGPGGIVYSVDSEGAGDREYSQQWPAAVPQTMVNAMQSGHGASVNGVVTSSNLNDTSDAALGTQHASLVTQLNTAASIRKLANPNIDMTGKSTVIWVKVDDITHLSTIDLYLGNASLANFFRFRVHTQGTAEAYSINSGEWVRLVVNWGDLASTTGAPVRTTITDWQIRVLDDNVGTVTFRVGGIATVPEPTQWPNGVVSLTFDDGYDSQFNEARKKMDTYGFPGTAYLIRDRIGTANFMTLAQLQQLQERSGWQIAAHANTTADHDNRLTSLTPDQLDADFRALKNWLLRNGFNGFDDFALPGGAFNPTVLAALARHFRSARTISDITHETIPVHHRLRLRSRTVISTDAAATIQTLIDNAFANKQWLILTFHKIVTSPANTGEYSIANFGTIIDYLNTKGIPVMTVGDVLRKT
jgi:peptidoglycan/xylan/chitin deacetylase (PgdA/CDA1 family)